MPTSAPNRHAGVLLHISSLPSSNLGTDAYHFVDFLASTSASVWQTLPINMPAGSSPYQCISTHAGNPDFICLKRLVDDGLLSAEELSLPADQVFKTAYQRFSSTDSSDDFAAFCQSEQFWLEDFAVYLLLRHQFKFACWNTWPDAFKHREEARLNQFKAEHSDALNMIKFTQYLFFTQWNRLKIYAKQKHIKLFGDIPIFVAYDSSDVWAQPHLFKLDENKEMSVVAGVPPDYFSETGQRWGNPHYNWEEMEKDGFNWWLTRIETQANLFDLVRIDHFRGLESAWEIPAKEPNAIKGNWAKAPGDALLATITANFPNIALIAEDLGIITEEVNALRLKYALPGMKILHFAFGGEEDNPYLPHNIEENSVTYTGTHDNDTTLGWYETIGEEEKQRFERYFNQHNKGKSITMPESLIEMALNTKSNLVIIPMQDILALGAEHRMNIPGTVEGNWEWRFEWQALNADHIHHFSEAVKNADRRES